MSELRDRTDHDGAGGPKWKITAKRKDRIVTAVRAGNYHYVAASYAGIGKSTFYKYLDLGEGVLTQAIDNRHLDAEAEPDTLRDALAEAGYAEHEILCAELVDELTRAEAEVEVRLVANWSKAAAEDWRAARDLLARRHALRWRDRTSVDLVGDVDGGPVRLTVSSDAMREVMTDPSSVAAASALLAAVVPSAPATSVSRFEADDDVDEDDDYGDG